MTLVFGDRASHAVVTGDRPAFSYSVYVPNELGVARSFLMFSARLAPSVRESPSPSSLA